MVSVTHSFAQTSQRLASRSLRALQHCQYCYKQEPPWETGRLFAFYAYCQSSRNLVYYAWYYHWAGYHPRQRWRTGGEVGRGAEL
jgi:hypothetical protein